MNKLISIFLIIALFNIQGSNCQQYALTKNFELISISESQKEEFLKAEDIMAIGSFIDDRNSSGWTFLSVNTSSKQSDFTQAMAAGYLEGYLGYNFVYDTYNNERILTGEISSDIFEYINNQTLWIEDQIALNPSDHYWQLVNTTLSLYQGIYNGYTDAVLHFENDSMIISPQEFYLMSYINEISDVESMLHPSEDVEHLPHCSFLLRLAENDLFVSHTTWAPYQVLLKTYKIYQFHFSNPMVKNNFISYSSQPGAVPSGDDFYVLENNKFVAETTLSSQNPEVYKFVHYESVPYWIRITVSNLAYDTQENWRDTFFTYRSGTYNNMWLVVDFDQYNTYKNNLTSASNIIWIVEEFYGMTSSQDVTQSLLIPQGYVASYNVPYSPLIQYYSQDSTNYTSDPRYFLFKKYAPNIQTLEEFQYVMRLNNISDTGDYCQAIAARCDLADGQEKATFGAIDCKVTSASLIQSQDSWIILGPTTENLPPFSWENWPKYENIIAGMNQVYNNSWYFVNSTNML